MSGAITNSGGAFATGKDDGLNHEERHGYAEGLEQVYKKYDDPSLENVITLSDNEKSDETLDLAYKVANRQGLKTEEEWTEYNSKLRKDRQKDSYEDYVKTTSKTITRRLEKEARPNSKNQKRARQQLNAIESNGGLPIEANLYYIGNAEKYDEILEADGEEALKRYREFEVETFRAFQSSEMYQKLHPYEVRAEIHTGENGAIHLQTSNVLGKSNKNGVYQNAPNAVREDILKDTFGTDEFHRMMLREAFAKHNGTQENPILDDELDSLDDEILELFEKDVYVKSKKPNPNYDGDLVKRVFRRVENKELERIALEKSFEKDVEWVRQYGVSDGQFRTGEEYRKNKEMLKEVDEHAKMLSENHEDYVKGQLITDLVSLVPDKSLCDMVEDNVLNMSEIYDDDYPTDIDNTQQMNEYNEPISTPYGLNGLQRLKSSLLKKCKSAYERIRLLDLNRKEKELEEATEKMIEKISKYSKEEAIRLASNGDKIQAHVINRKVNNRIREEASEGFSGASRESSHELGS